MKNSSYLSASYLPAYEDGTDKSVPKRWHTKFRRRRITQKKAYIKNFACETSKVGTA